MKKQNTKLNSTKPHGFLIVCTVAFAILVIAAVGSFLAYRSDEYKNKRMTAETEAEITERVPIYRTDNDEGRPGGIRAVRISYKYAIGDGSPQERVVVVGRIEGDSYKVGEPAKVCYNPSDISEAKLFPANHKCGK
jgi:hypothetical protein